MELLPDLRGNFSKELYFIDIHDGTRECHRSLCQGDVEISAQATVRSF